MGARMYARLVDLSLALLLSCGCCLASAAADSTQSELNMNDLSILEHRFFSHSYAHDPAEKRLERLECLVFGSTRAGSNAERMARLNKTVALRSQQPLPVEKPSHFSAEPPQLDRLSNSSKQYPVLNTLEWKALKKTYPGESLDQRLDRLESKMFGQPAQTMAYIDRVDRLKKTLGIGITPEVAGGLTTRGPMPKAQPRGQGGDFGGMAPLPLDGYPPPSALNPFFGNGDFFGDTAFGGMRQIQQMMQNFDRQMNEMRKSGNTRTWVYDPETGQWVEQEPRGQTGAAPGPKPKATTPGDSRIIKEVPGIKDVPGYADPNSI